MAPPMPALALSHVEAVYLGCLLGADSLMGLPDPFQGWIAGEVRQALVDARDRLVVRGVITPHPDGTVEVDERARVLIQAAGFSDATVILSSTNRVSARMCVFHLTRDLVVQQVPQDGLQGLEFTLLPATAYIPGRVIDFFGLHSQAAASTPGGIIAEKALADVGKSPGTDATTLLQQAGLPESTADALAATLTDLRSNGALLSLTRQADTWHADGFAFVDGPGGLWQLRNVTETGDVVEVQPCSAKAAIVEIRRLLQSAWPIVEEVQVIAVPGEGPGGPL